MAMGATPPPAPPPAWAPGAGAPAPTVGQVFLFADTADVYVDRGPSPSLTWFIHVNRNETFWDLDPSVDPAAARFTKTGLNEATFEGIGPIPAPPPPAGVPFNGYTPVWIVATGWRRYFGTYRKVRFDQVNDGDHFWNDNPSKYPSTEYVKSGNTGINPVTHATALGTTGGGLMRYIGAALGFIVVVFLALVALDFFGVIDIRNNDPQSASITDNGKVSELVGNPDRSSLVVGQDYPGIDGKTYRVMSNDAGFPVRLSEVTAIVVAPQPQTGSGQQPTVTGDSGTASCPTNVNQIEWSAAGPAPQTKQEAAALLQTDPRDVTILTYPCPGNEVAIGWVVGTSDTEKAGKIQNLGFVPAWTCVDYDEGPSQVYADLAHHQKFDPVNDRSLLASNGSASGLKFSVYWTPCVFSDNSGFTASVAYTPVSASVPTTTVVVTQPDAGQPRVKKTFECPLGNPNAYINAVVKSHRAKISTGPIGSNGYLLTSSKPFTVKRTRANWILQTPKYDGMSAATKNGLPMGKQETLTRVSVYCEA